MRNPIRTSRRTALAGAGLAGLAGWAAARPAEALGRRRHKKRKPRSTSSTTTFPQVSFEHGVASGDPLASAVVIWTRVTPGPEAAPGSGVGPRVAGRWEVATDPAFTSIVRSGEFVTTAGRDHAVKVDVTGLSPESWYWYRFAVPASETVTRRRRRRRHHHRRHQRHGRKGRARTTRTTTYVHSPVGRTRTAPAPATTPANLRFGVATCANMQEGYFSAYRGLAARDDLHAIVFLGDYLYESGGGQHVRTHVPPREIVSLSDYRQRHAQYKQDRDLQALHAKYPWVPTWDDHEVVNDAYDGGAPNHNPATEGDFTTRRAWAYRAYDEWMPVRMNDTAEIGDGTRLYRRFRFGTLLELSMLDLRTYRSKQVDPALPDNPAPLPEPNPAVDDPSRTITGEAQLAWLKEGLSNRAVQWKIVGNPVMIAPLTSGALPAAAADAVARLVGAPPRDGSTFNADQWDGYTADRRELFAHIRDQAISDALFVTGDIHGAFAAELPLDKGSYPLGGTAGAEFVVTSVTSDNLDDALGTPRRSPASLAVEGNLMANNQHIKYINFDDHGFSILDVTAERAQMDWYVVGDRSDPATPITWTQSWRTRAGTGRIEQVAGPMGS